MHRPLAASAAVAPSSPKQSHAVAGSINWSTEQREKKEQWDSLTHAPQFLSAIEARLVKARAKESQGGDAPAPAPSEGGKKDQA